MKFIDKLHEIDLGQVEIPLDVFTCSSFPLYINNTSELKAKNDEDALKKMSTITIAKYDYNGRKIKTALKPLSKSLIAYKIHQ